MAAGGQSVICVPLTTTQKNAIQEAGVVLGAGFASQAECETDCAEDLGPPVPTDCCAESVPRRLYATFAGGMNGTIQLDYNEGLSGGGTEIWTGTGDTDCTTATAVTLTCNGDWGFKFDACPSGAVSEEETSCVPLLIEFGSISPCVGFTLCSPGVTVTITE